MPEPKVGKNRLHIDVQVGGGGRDATPWEVRWPRVQAEVERLTAAGATVLAVHELDGRGDHVVVDKPGGQREFSHGAS